MKMRIMERMISNISNMKNKRFLNNKQILIYQRNITQINNLKYKIAVLELSNNC